MTNERFYTANRRFHLTYRRFAIDKEKLTSSTNAIIKLHDSIGKFQVSKLLEEWSCISSHVADNSLRFSLFYPSEPYSLITNRVITETMQKHRQNKK